jgi:TRAP-type mannitol/chloroaromatic compound transport system substrate-binding protein
MNVPKYFASRIEKASGGRLKIEVLPAGTIVPAAEMLDAVSKGVLDVCHGWSGYHVGKNSACALFTGLPAFGMDQLTYYMWLYFGDGLKLYNELLTNEMKLNVIAFFMGGDVPEPLGWFKKPVTSWADFKGLKFRAGGYGAEIYKEAGATVVAMSGGDIIPAAQRGVIDGAEWSDPTSDMTLGFQDVWKYYHMPGIHQPISWTENAINKKRFEELPEDLQELVRTVSNDTAFYTSLQLYYRNAIDLEVLKTKHGVNVVETPKEILIETLKAWDKVAEKKAAENPAFKRVLESQKAFAARQVPYMAKAVPPYELSADHYWKK